MRLFKFLTVLLITALYVGVAHSAPIKEPAAIRTSCQTPQPPSPKGVIVSHGDTKAQWPGNVSTPRRGEATAQEWCVETRTTAQTPPSPKGYLVSHGDTKARGLVNISTQRRGEATAQEWCVGTRTTAEENIFFAV